MPISEKAVQIIGSRGILTDEQWMKLLRELCDELSPWFHRITMPILGSVGYERNWSNSEVVLGTNETEFFPVNVLSPADGAFLKQQGWYASRRLWSPNECISHQLIYGYTRRHEWVVCEIAGSVIDFKHQFDSVVYKIVSPADIVREYPDVSYHELWHLLTRNITSCRNEALERFEHLDRLCRRVSTLQVALELFRPQQ